jgi:haloacid dehalogenase-like hydrolase
MAGSEAASVLPSWNDSAAKSAILDFVARVTKEGGPDFVPSAERIATFDNDGMLWCEQPFQVQVFFLSDRVKELTTKDASIKERQPFKAFLEHDLKTLQSLGKQSILELFAATHAGMSEEDFDAIAQDWFARAKHPKFGRLFKNLTYRPQVELLGFLRENAFKTFIVSGGGIDLIRAFAEEAYDIPREQVIGSSAKLRFEAADSAARLMKLPELNSFDDREVKPANIGLHIGRRPILAFGNSDGDLAMLRYCKTGSGARLALLVHHDDAEREIAYDREFRLSPLVEALDQADQYGITLVSKRSSSSTTAPASRSASTASSASGRSSRSATRMATTRCCNTRRRVPARVSWASCTTPTPSANGPTIASPTSASSIKHWTRERRRAGLSST